MAGSKTKETSRLFLPRLLNKLCLFGKGVEVGVWEGKHARTILSRWRGEMLFGVDPYKMFEFKRDGKDITDSSNADQGTYDRIKKIAMRVEEEHRNFQLIVDSSCVASKLFKDESLDFVYIDGRHFYEGVMEDLTLWYPKVKTGGLFCGHDYLNRIEAAGYPKEGKAAVDEFCEKKNEKAYGVNTKPSNSWICCKGEELETYTE